MAWVSSFVMVTAAPGIMAWVGSSTVPEMLALNWAFAERPVSRSSAMQASFTDVTNLIFIVPPKAVLHRSNGRAPAHRANKSFRQPFDLIGRVVPKPIHKCQVPDFCG